LDPTLTRSKLEPDPEGFRPFDSLARRSAQTLQGAECIAHHPTAALGKRDQGYVTPDEARADIARWKAAPSDFLLDPGGNVGHLYDARATPHMVVIDRSGLVAYMGAIDDKPSVNPADVRTANNYVVAALEALAAGRPVAISATRAYGCSVKYKSS